MVVSCVWEQVVCALCILRGKHCECNSSVSVLGVAGIISRLETEAS